MRLSLFVLAFLLLTTVAHSQTQTLEVGGPIYWDYNGPDGATIASYTYKLYDNGVAVVPLLAGVRCLWNVSGTLWSCKVNLPTNLTVGDHLFTVTATTPDHAESDIAGPLPLTLALPKSAPVQNLRLIR